MYCREQEDLYSKIQDIEWQLKESYSEIANLKIELSFHKSSGCSKGSSSVIEHVHSEDSDSNTANEGHENGSSQSAKRQAAKGELEGAMFEINRMKLEIDHFKQNLELRNDEIHEQKQVRVVPN